MTAPQILSTFTGYGGLDLAVQTVLGGRVIACCDNDPAAAAVLAHHHPDTPNLGDITTVDWPRLARRHRVDVLCGGFPCQDLSAAGRRAGLTPATRSGLWAHLRRAIAVLRPDLVVIENVRGILSAPAHRDLEPRHDLLGDRAERPVLRALGTVLGDLAELGYDARWCGLRAADIGAPHTRFRVFLVAAAADTDGLGRQRCRRARRRGQRPADHDRSSAHPDGPGPQGTEPARGPLAPSTDRWGAFAPAIARWERILGRPAPAPTEPGRRGTDVLSPRFVEWLMGLPAGHVTGVPDLSRAAQLRLLGNGVLPHQAVAALRILLDTEEVPT